MSGLIHPVRSLRSDGGQIEIRASSSAELYAWAWRHRFPVAIGEGKHPFPFRIRKLSPLPAMVLTEQFVGRVANCRDLLLKTRAHASGCAFFMCAQHETKLGGGSPLRVQVAGTSRETQGGSP